MSAFKYIGLAFVLVIIFTNCNKATQPPPPVTDTVVSLTHPDHIIFVWFENKNYDSIVGSSQAPYINSGITGGTLFTNMFAVTHPSYPNYVDFFSGEPNGIITDQCMTPAAFTTPNLYTQLNTKGKSFAWYSEDLPSAGSTVCRSGAYVAKHNPTTIFTNVPGPVSKPFSDFPVDFSKLENVVCISPNMMNDMHDGSISRGDEWLKNNLSSLVEWCKTHNSVFVIYFDENDKTGENKIPVIAIGQHIKVNYKETGLYNHYSWTKTISKMFSASTTWTSNVQSARVITGCWK